MDCHDGEELAVIKICITTEKLPPAICEKLLKAIGNLKRVGRQANRENPGSVIVGDVERPTGLERIATWSKENSKPQHYEAFLRGMGSAVCKLGLYEKCERCPAKKHKVAKLDCKLALGAFLTHREGAGNE